MKKRRYAFAKFTALMLVSLAILGAGFHALELFGNKCLHFESAETCSLAGHVLSALLMFFVAYCAFFLTNKIREGAGNDVQGE